MLSIHASNETIDILIIRLGRHLIAKSCKTNLYDDFYQLIKILRHSAWRDDMKSSKNQALNMLLERLIQINNWQKYNLKSPLEMEQLYLNLYYDIINESFYRE